MVLLDTILDGIKTILEADADTKDVIKLYRKYDIVEKGITKTPVCVIGPVLNAEISVKDIGTLHNFDLPIGIQLLDRSYTIPARHQAIISVLDVLQQDVCEAITAAPTLSSTVLECSIDGLRYIRPSDEYVGFEVTLAVRTCVE